MISPILSMMSNPILSSRFFKDHKPTSALYQKWREIYSWSIKCLPVYEWDGVLFVGCLQTPTDFPAQVANAKIVFVLCDPEALKSCWHEFEGTIPYMAQGKAAIPTAAKETAAIPAATKETAEEENFSINGNDHSVPEFKVDLSEEKLTSPVISSKSEEVPVAGESAEAPEVISEELPAENAAPEGLSLEGLTQEEKPSEPAPEDLLAAEEAPAPEASADSHSEEISGKDSAPDGLIFDTKFEAPKFDAEVLKTMTSIRVAKEPEEQQPAAAAAAQPKKAAPKPSPMAPAAKEEKKATPAKTEIIYTKPGALSSNREAVEKTSVSGLHRAVNKLTEVTQNVFSEMSYHYQKSMLLLAENDEARPWKWSEQFHPQSPNDIHAISMAIPNPFRIVARSQKSYHGYVVPNESSDKFFEEWNESKTPDHLTISPILIDDTLVGFLVGFGDKSADNKNSLLLCEKLANDVSIQLKRDPQLLKAA